jgi:hypothetical protein
MVSQNLAGCPIEHANLDGTEQSRTPLQILVEEAEYLISIELVGSLKAWAAFNFTCSSMETLVTPCISWSYSPAEALTLDAVAELGKERLKIDIPMSMSSRDAWNWRDPRCLDRSPVQMGLSKQVPLAPSNGWIRLRWYCMVTRSSLAPAAAIANQTGGSSSCSLTMHRWRSGGRVSPQCFCGRVSATRCCSARTSASAACLTMS